MSMRLSLQIVFVFLMSLPAFAKEIKIFDVRKNLAMSDDEPVYRDFYINAGSDEGLKRGMVIEVKRRKAVYDAYTNKSPGDLVVSVGQLQIIHVQETMSVAREYKTFDRDERPVLEYNFLLVGDRLDVSTAAIKPFPKRKNKTVAVVPTKIEKQVQVAKAVEVVKVPKPKEESKEMASKGGPESQPPVSLSQQN